jgi:hypothetical protein
MRHNPVSGPQVHAGITVPEQRLPVVGTGEKKPTDNKEKEDVSQ